MTRLQEDLDRWAPPALAMTVFLTIALFAASLAVGYWGDEYASPAWDEASFPAPTTY